MKVAILCGGKGTRLKELTEEIPKPLVEIGGKPILWHIMKIYSHYGFNDFILCLGYKGNLIEEYFRNNSNKEQRWNIEFVDTEENSNKGQRIKKIENYIKEDNFFVAYGDDVSDVNIKKVLEQHMKNNKIVTLTAVNPESQFGIMDINHNNEIIEFKEKPKLDHWINGGFFVFNKRIFDYLKDNCDLETDAFKALVKEKQITAFKHDGFWKCMNTFKDTMELNELWDNDKAPWKVE
ncbi:MAG: NTP transferase domain-containing protein [Nanoarchaeota archaeon]|nr:NTP transferase domain-containing protein [Nanoarchaeota archaeon]MBU1004769.1 NTP transferase domain-containing protein [Nanoarchaeota archaeon]MBU1946825.1 NTP transferase domain-containing protein [Nanoarchaeota archaeon]